MELDYSRIVGVGDGLGIGLLHLLSPADQVFAAHGHGGQDGEGEEGVNCHWLPMALGSTLGSPDEDNFSFTHRTFVFIDVFHLAPFFIFSAPSEVRQSCYAMPDTFPRQVCQPLHPQGRRLLAKPDF